MAVKPRILIMDEPSAVLARGRLEDALRADPAAARRRRAGALHLASPRRAVRDRRSGHGAEGRCAGRHRRSPSIPTGRPDPADGRPHAAGDLSPAAAEDRRRASDAEGPQPGGQLRRRLLRCRARRDRRPVRIDGQRPDRGRALRVRRRPADLGRDPARRTHAAPALAARRAARRHRHAHRGPDRRRPGAGAARSATTSAWRASTR